MEWSWTSRRILIKRVKLTHMDDVDDSNKSCHIYESIFMKYITYMRLHMDEHELKKQK